jgi:hypothetical protein
LKHEKGVVQAKGHDDDDNEEEGELIDSADDQDKADKDQNNGLEILKL